MCFFSIYIHILIKYIYNTWIKKCHFFYFFWYFMYFTYVLIIYTLKTNWYYCFYRKYYIFHRKLFLFFYLYFIFINKKIFFLNLCNFFLQDFFYFRFQFSPLSKKVDLCVVFDVLHRFEYSFTLKTHGCFLYAYFYVFT